MAELISITKVYVCDPESVTSTHLGTLKTDWVKIKKGPSGLNLIGSCGFGQACTFTLENELGNKFGSFRTQDWFEVKDVGLINARGLVPVHIQEKREFPWHIEFWHFSGNSHVPTLPMIHFKGIYNAKSRKGNLITEELRVSRISEMVQLPGFRWRKDIASILKIKEITVTNDVNLTSFDDELNDIGSGDFASRRTFSSEYGGVKLTMIKNEPWILIPHEDMAIEGLKYMGIELSEAIKNPDVEVEFGKK